jgi:hypothetical protein
VSEPEYRYVKGQGWIPCISVGRTFCSGNCIITIEHRIPLDGENFFTQHDTLFKSSEELLEEALTQAYWSDIFCQPEDVIRSKMPIWGPMHYHIKEDTYRGPIFVIVWTKIN